MNLLNKNELLKLLLSPDIENRKIAETYLLSNFDLDFLVIQNTDFFTSKSFYEIDDGKTTWFECSAKQVLHWQINDKYPTPYLKLLLDRIYEYNNK